MAGGKYSVALTPHLISGILQLTVIRSGVVAEQQVTLSFGLAYLTFDTLNFMIEADSSY